MKSKYLQKRIKEQEKKTAIKMKKWWNQILPRKGSLLRQLVDLELNNNKK